MRNKNKYICGSSFPDKEDRELYAIAARPKGTGVYFLFRCVRCGWFNIYFSRRKCSGLKKS